MSRAWDATKIEGIDGKAKGVLIALAILEDEYGVGKACPSIDTLAEMVSVDRRTVQRALMRLSDMGVVESHVRKGRSTNRFTLNLECVTVPPNYSSTTTSRPVDSREVSNPSGLTAARVEITPTPVIGRKLKEDRVQPGQIEDDPEDTVPVPRPVKLNAGTLGRKLVTEVTAVAPTRAGTMTYGAAGGFFKNMITKGTQPTDLSEAITAFCSDGDIVRDLRSNRTTTVYALFSGFYQRWVARKPVEVDWDAEAAEAAQGRRKR